MDNEYNTDGLTLNEEQLTKEIEEVLNRDMSDCKDTSTDKEPDPCDCINSTVGEEDPCYKDFMNRFHTIGMSGDTTGFMFDGQGLVPCLNIDAIFDCQMLGTRALDYVLSSNRFLSRVSNNSLFNVG